jgi:hypothetical protein
LLVCVSAAFFNHPVDPVSGHEILVGDTDDFQIAFLRFGAKGGFRQPPMEEQLRRFGKRNWLVVTDIQD